MTTPAQVDPQRVESKRHLHMGRMQDTQFYLEAALEAAYEELERRAVRIAELEAKETSS